MHRVFTLVALLATVAVCTNPNDPDKAPEPLGDFWVAHNVDVTPNITKRPASRDATDRECVAAMTKAVDERFSRYDGEGLYNLGVSIEVRGA